MHGHSAGISGDPCDKENSYHQKRQPGDIAQDSSADFAKKPLSAMPSDCLSIIIPKDYSHRKAWIVERSVLKKKDQTSGTTSEQKARISNDSRHRRFLRLTWDVMIMLRS
jgi:hypothetical protein